MSYFGDNDAFISAVQAQPALWDNGHQDDSDRVKKRNAWMAIIKEFVNDFDDKAPAEQKEIGKLCL